MIDGVVYFAANTRREGRELWRSDGTEAGTRLVADMSTGSASSSPGGFTKVNGRILFTADAVIKTGSGRNGQTTFLGRELWRTDGTSAGTALVKDINLGFDSSSPSEFTVVDGTLFFTARTPALGGEVWKRRHDRGHDAAQGHQSELPLVECESDWRISRSVVLQCSRCGRRHGTLA